jgi:TPP-dependent pyruvate/acetoin dehydrogenase alpha subunit
VRDAATEVVARVRAGGGPEFVEARTYRFVGHSRSDPGKYRPEGELDRWRERDPLTVASAMLVGELGVSEEAVDRVRADVAAELERIESSALQAPFPAEISIPEFSGV